MRNNKTISNIKSVDYSLARLPQVNPVCSARMLIDKAQRSASYDLQTALNLTLEAQNYLSTFCDESARINCNVKSARSLLKAVGSMNVAVQTIYKNGAFAEGGF